MLQKFVSAAVLLMLFAEAQSQVVKSTALEHLAEMEKTIALDARVLRQLRDPKNNPTLLTRDQNVRYLQLIEKSNATFGDNPLSPQGACVKVFWYSHEAWQSKVAYEKSSSNFDRDRLARWQKMLSSENEACRFYLGKT